MLNKTFTSVRELIRWLEDKNWECGSLEEFEAWLHDFFDNGNTITVNGEEFDYWTCWELI